MENKAKEKAVELYDKFRSKFFGPSYKSLSIQCALICVEELIIQNGELYLNGCPEDYYRSKNGFLFEVKEHLNAMK